MSKHNICPKNQSCMKTKCEKIAIRECSKSLVELPGTVAQANTNLKHIILLLFLKVKLKKLEYNILADLQTKVLKDNG